MRLGPWAPRLALGALGVGLVVAVVLISLDERKGERIEIKGGPEVQQLYGGIAQDGPWLGPREAPVTVAVFNDLQAPSGADYQLETVEPLVEDYARTGEARLELRHFSFTGHRTNLAAYGVVAAGGQGRAWQYADLFFRNQDEAPGGLVDDEFLADVARAVPELGTDDWREAFDSAAVRDRVEADADLTTELGFPAGATVVITAESGTKTLEDYPSLHEIEAAIASLE
jgi:protein-disulfide isomerase